MQFECCVLLDKDLPATKLKTAGIYWLGNDLVISRERSCLCLQLYMTITRHFSYDAGLSQLSDSTVAGFHWNNCTLWFPFLGNSRWSASKFPWRIWRICWYSSFAKLWWRWTKRWRILSKENKGYNNNVVALNCCWI